MKRSQELRNRAHPGRHPGDWTLMASFSYTKALTKPRLDPIELSVKDKETVPTFPSRAGGGRSWLAAWILLLRGKDALGGLHPGSTDADARCTRADPQASIKRSSTLQALWGLGEPGADTTV
jgi:hypothetical protein